MYNYSFYYINLNISKHDTGNSELSYDKYCPNVMALNFDMLIILI
jgi:hypothetical protein